MIKIFRPYISWRARWYALKVLLGTQLAEGPVAAAFEREFAQRYHVNPQCCVLVNSGTTALELAYKLAGLKKGDEVIVPVLTCTATNLPLVHLGVKIIFADIDPQTLTLDPRDVQKRITKKTKAIVYVDFGGSTATLGEILDLTHQFRLTLIRDAAQSVSDNFRPDGDFVCVSFQAIKTLTAGDGGMVIVNENRTGCIADAARGRRLRWFGYDRNLKQLYGDCDLIEAGYKWHLNDLAAAVGLGNLRSIEYAINRRNRAARAYRGYQGQIERLGGRLLIGPWMVTLVHPRAIGIGKRLARDKIEAKQHHFRNDKYTVFGGRRKDLPAMDAIENQYVHLPFHHRVTPLQVDRIMKRVIYTAHMYGY